MFVNYFKTAFRSLLKNKSLSFINIGGLAVGMASALLLLGFVTFELSYDAAVVNKKDIYRVNLSSYEQDKLVFKSAESFAGLAPALKSEVPEVIDAVRLYNVGYKNNCVFTYKESAFRETKFLYADQSFPSLFSIEFLKGDKNALSAPNTAIISSSFAKKVFGAEDPVGQKIQMNDDDRNSVLCLVTGVYKDQPENAHLKFNVLISWATLYRNSNDRERFENWNRKDVYTYVLLRPGAQPEKVETKLAALIAKYAPDAPDNSGKRILNLQPLQSLHFSSGLIDEPETTENRKAISFLFVIAFFIVTIAWVNYINMVTASSANRAKEVGVRKTLGSQRPELVKQFLIESFTVNLLAAAIAAILVILATPVLETIFDVQFTIKTMLYSGTGWACIGFIIAGTILSGVYPAFVLSSFKPITALKGSVKMPGGNLILRKSLVVFQFTLSIFMIIGTLVVFKQVRYMLHQDLGMNTSQVVVLDRPGKWDTARIMHNNYVQRFKTTLEADPLIEGVGMSDELPGKAIRYASDFTLYGSTSQLSYPINTIGINENFLPALQFRFVAGHNFRKEVKADNGGLIITELVAKQFGFADPSQAIGKELSSGGSKAPVIGVVNDFHQLSLQQRAEPIIFQYNGSDAREFEYYLVKTKSTNFPAAISRIQAAWNSSFKNNPFTYSFLDESFNRQYKNIERFERLFTVFAIIAIVIACTGLFTLLAFIIQQRVKEIGIRKVLGASLQDIVLLLSKDFLRLVLLANVFAWPLGWLVMNNWLKDFAYRTTISIYVFIFSFLVAMVIAISTISLQAIKAALANPVESLHSE